MAGIVFSVLYGGLTFAIQPAAMWRRYPELHGDQIVCLFDHGVRTELTNRHSTADWTFWSRASRIGDIYVLEAKDQGYCFIPARSLSAGDETRLRALLQQETQAGPR